MAKFYWLSNFTSVQFSSVAQSCPTLYNPINRSTPGLPVHHQLLEFTHSCPSSRWCHTAISSSVVPFSSCPQSLPASGSFPVSHIFAWGGQSIGVSASALVLPMNTQDWSPLGWTGWISLQSKGLSRVFSKPQFKSINFSALSFLHSPILTSIRDHWKNHSLDQTDLCWQSNVSAYGNLYVSVLPSQFILLSPFPIVSPLLPCKQVHQCCLSRFHTYALRYDTCLSLSYFTLHNRL